MARKRPESRSRSGEVQEGVGGGPEPVAKGRKRSKGRTWVEQLGDSDGAQAGDEQRSAHTWKVRSRSQEGFATEKKIAKKRGARLHPRSGAGKIKDDASTEDTVLEVKDAARTHTIQGAALDTLLTRAHRQGKGAEYIVHFADVGITLTGTLTRGMG